MSRLIPEVKELLDWVDGDAFKEAVLIAETPIKPASLLQLKNGTYVPSQRMINSMKAVKAKYLDGVRLEPGSKRATGT